VVSDLINQYPQRFAVVTYHADDSYTVPWGQDRFNNFYSLVFTPTLMLDGTLNCPSADYAACLGQSLGISTDVTLQLSGTQVSGSTWDIGVMVCIEAGRSHRDLRIYTAATLNNHPDLPSYSQNLLMQAALTEDVTLSDGNCQTITQRITFDALSWSSQNDITIIAWAQDPNAAGPAAVYQAGIMHWPFPQAPELTTIEISPSSAELEVGESRSFTATGKDQYGADFALSNPVWAMTGDGDGTFSPPSGNATTEFSATLPGELQITCTDGSVSGAASIVITGDPPVLTDIVVSPANAEMEIGQPKLFAAVGHDQYGNLLALSDPQWQATGDGSGTFDPPSGSPTSLFTGDTPGAVQVICSEGDISGQASVVINGDPPQLAAITISPETATLAVGSSLVFTASGTDQYGDPFTPDNAAWSITGVGDGTFDPQTGSATTTFTASDTGNGVIAAQQDGIEATASINITDEGLPKPRRIKARHTP